MTAIIHGVVCTIVVDILYIYSYNSVRHYRHDTTTITTVTRIAILRHAAARHASDRVFFQTAFHLLCIYVIF